MKPKINFETYPEIYNHWELKFEKNTAFLIMKVDEDKGFFEGYKLKLNRIKYETKKEATLLEGLFMGLLIMRLSIAVVLFHI